MNDESLAKDYLPDPPTPTNKALPTGKSIILAILEMCSIATSKSTRSIVYTYSLYSYNLASSTVFNYDISATGM